MIKLEREEHIGLLASSIAGHDKGKIYVIIKEEEDCFWLADGKTRTITYPKKKKHKHVQLIKEDQVRRVLTILREEERLSDLEIKRVLKEYEARREQR